MLIGLSFIATGCSSEPFEVKATATAELELLPSPNNVVATLAKATQEINFTWSMLKNADKVERYFILGRLEDSGAVYGDIDSTIEQTTSKDSVTTINHTVTPAKLTLGFGTYEFRVQGLSNDGSRGFWSDPVTVNYQAIKSVKNTVGTNGAFGSKGSGNNQFTTPSGVITDSAGNIFVTDTGNNRVLKLNSSGEQVGAPAGGFTKPTGICIDSNPAQTVFVTNEDADTISKFNTSFGAAVNIPKGTTGLGDLNTPSACAIGKDSRLAVVARNSNKLYISTDNNYNNFQSVGGSGTGDTQLDGPSAVTSFNFTGVGDGFAVLDRNNKRITFFDLNRNFKGKIELSSDLNNGNAEGMTIVKTTFNGQANTDIIYVSDTANNVVRLYKPTIDGGNITGAATQATIGQKGSDSGQFDAPKGVFHDAAGNLFIVDSNNNRIQVFKD